MNNTTKESFLPIDVARLSEISGNLYRSLSVIGKRSNQITVEVREELTRKLEEFAPSYDNLEEIMENKEQIEISKHYERKPKSVEIALGEFFEDQILWRDPHVEEEE